MSYKHVNHVRDWSKTKGAARLILWAIASRTDENGYAYPGYTCLSRDTKLPIRTVVRAMKEIPPDELVIVRAGSSEKGKKRQSAIYRVEIARQENRKTPDHRQGVTSNQCQGVNGEGTTNDIFTPDHCRGVTSTIDNFAHDHGRGVTLTVIEQSIEQKEEQSASPSASLTDLFVAQIQKTEELPPTASPKPSQPPETKEELISRLQNDFGAVVDVQEAAAKYEQHLTETKQTWKNGRFVMLVEEMNRKIQAKAAYPVRE